MDGIITPQAEEEEADSFSHHGNKESSQTENQYQETTRNKRKLANPILKKRLINVISEKFFSSL